MSIIGTRKRKQSTRSKWQTRLKRSSRPKKWLKLGKRKNSMQSKSTKRTKSNVVKRLKKPLVMTGTVTLTKTPPYLHNFQTMMNQSNVQLACPNTRTMKRMTPSPKQKEKKLNPKTKEMNLKKSMTG